METEYRRNYGQSYMVIKGEEIVDTFDLTMLQENYVEGLLQLEVAVTDGRQQYWYNISGKQALDVWFGEHRPGRKELKQFFFGLASVLQNMEPYLLNESALSLKMTDIYVNPMNGKFYFCYCPFQTSEFQKSLQEFMELFLQKMDHECNEDVQICYMIYENTRRENISMEELLKCFQAENGMEFSEEQKDYQEEWQPKAEIKGKIPEKKRFPLLSTASVEKKPKEVKSKEIIQKESKRKENKYAEKKPKEKVLKSKNILNTEKLLESVKLPSIGKKEQRKEPPFQEMQYVATPEDVIQEEIIHPTILLGSDQASICGRLVYKGNSGEDSFIIEEMPFYIGTYAKEVKGVLKSSTVSRIHSKITKEKEEYFIEDMNSTNGTYVNGEILSYREKRKLEKNDEIAFADAVYCFI